MTRTASATTFDAPDVLRRALAAMTFLLVTVVWLTERTTTELFRGYAFDVVGAGQQFILLRLVQEASPWKTVRTLVGRNPRGAALAVVVVLSVAEIAQKWNPYGLAPGTFDPLDFVAYAVGTGLAYAAERRLTITASPSR